jgi:hypothetical protein
MAKKTTKQLQQNKPMLLALAVIGLMVLLGLASMVGSGKEEVTNFEDCVAAGYPVAESYPPVCRTADKSFRQPVDYAP